MTIRITLARERRNHKRQKRLYTGIRKRKKIDGENRRRKKMGRGEKVERWL